MVQNHVMRSRELFNQFKVLFLFTVLLPVFAVAEPSQKEAVILTPPAPPSAQLHCPAIYGAHPGSPFLYRIPATGVSPITFAARQLPPGLALDAATGIITG